MPTAAFRPSRSLYRPNPGAQLAFMRDHTHRYCALAGGWFAGKTWAGARKLCNLHLKNAFDSTGHPTFVKSAVIAPTYQLATDFDIPEIRRALDEMCIRHTFLNDPKRFCFILPDLGSRRRPSQILVRSADRPDRLTGWTAGAIWGDEVARWKNDRYNPQYDPFIQADARLRDPRANFLQFMVTFTHEGDDTRVYRDFELEPKPDHVLYRAGTTDNPHAAAFAAVQRQQLTGDLASQYLDGIACSTTGQRMYVNFDAQRNVDASLAIVDDLPLQLAVDFNITPGMHAILGQHFPRSTGVPPVIPPNAAPTDLLTAVWEIHDRNMSVKTLVESLRRLIDQHLGGWRWGEHRPLQIFGDASGSNRWAGAGQSCYDLLCEALRHHGIPHQIRVPRANPHVVDRVNAVNAALCSAAGCATYVIHPRCQRLIDDYRLMRWEPDRAGPDKSDAHRSHASDADGYRVHYLCPIRRVNLMGQVSVLT